MAAPAERLQLRDIIKLARPGDWTKNSFVLLAFIFWAANAVRTQTTDAITEKAIAAALAFAAFCCVASGFYCINDAMDAEKDRQHPVKCRRPVAAGRISRATAIGIGVVLVALACVLSFLVSKMLAVAVVVYAVLQLGYNGGLKRVAFVDVATIATGFGLRAAAGAIAIGVPISVWLVLCVFFLCLYLGFIKRMCDLVSAERAGSAWKSPAGYRGREELQWLLGISAVMTVSMYLSYTLSEHAWNLFGPRATGLALLTPFVLIAIHRFWRRANEGSSDSPLEALKSDRVVLISILLFVGLLGVVLFAPSAGTMLERVFLTQGARA
ncbi:MAG: UbiA prenyltransferase family protein [Limnohabitans sp.]|jgi:decaprenyl-phosphate phosphoribosyltransferase|nr:UbiA prenyltransferase family protein [Limnohabitans sp.]